MDAQDLIEVITRCLCDTRGYSRGELDAITQTIHDLYEDKRRLDVAEEGLAAFSREIDFSVREGTGLSYLISITLGGGGYIAPTLRQAIDMAIEDQEDHDGQ